MSRKKSEKIVNHDERFAKIFCREVNKKHICYSPEEGLYVSDDDTLLYAKSLNEMDRYFYCEEEERLGKELLPCVWQHNRKGEQELYIKKLENIHLPENKKVLVKNKRKPVPVLKFGRTLVDKEKFERALRVFLGDPVKIYYSENRPIEPVVIEDLKTKEAIMISPYY